MIAAARAEPAAGRVQAELETGGAGISWINLGEAFYVLMREYGEGPAWETIERSMGVLSAEEPDAELVLAAARIKGAHTLSYADSFAVATAERHRAPVMTGDPEITALDRAGLDVVDLRS